VSTAALEDRNIFTRRVVLLCLVHNVAAAEEVAARVVLLIEGLRAGGVLCSRALLVSKVLAQISVDTWIGLLSHACRSENLVPV